MEIPFSYGRLAEKDTFIDREDDKRELKNFLRHGINVILVSPRRWGKSSLVKEAMKELAHEDNGTRICFLDAYKIHTEEDFYNQFASAVIQGVSTSIEKRFKDIVKFVNRITPSITINGDPMNSMEVNLKTNPAKESPESILRLPEEIAKAKKIKVIVCIDEFQQLANIANWERLESMLRSEWQQQHLTTYCLYGSKMHMMTRIFNNANSPFFKFGQLMRLKRIGKEYWIPYITDNFKKTNKSISTELAEQICDTVKYNSWYVQQYCFFVWSHVDSVVTAEDLSRQLQLLLDTNEEMFQNELDGLAPSQIAMLKAMAAGEQHYNSEAVVSKYGLGLPRTITRNKKVLFEKDLIEKDRDGFHFVDPVFELWIRREYGIPQPSL